MSGLPRPDISPSLDSASANPMLMPAPSGGQAYHEGVVRLPGHGGRCNSGARVDTEPSMRPSTPG